MINTQFFYSIASYTFFLCAKTRIGCDEISIIRLQKIEKRGIKKVLLDRSAAPYSPPVKSKDICSYAVHG